MRTIALFTLLLACIPAMAQQPDCTVLGHTGSSGLHESPIVVRPNTNVVLEAHCNSAPGAPAPTYAWNIGGNSFDRTVPAPTAEGQVAAYSVTVTQGSAQRTFPYEVRTPAPGTPTCIVTVAPSGNVPVFALVALTAHCDNATGWQWTGGYDLRATNDTATVFNVVNQPQGILAAVDLIPSNLNGPGALVEANLQYTLAAPSCRIVATPAGTVAPATAVTLTADCDGVPTSYRWSTGATGASTVVRPEIPIEYSLTASNAAGISDEVALAVPVAATPPASPPQSTGLWWVGSAENGWGVTLIQHGRQVFGVLYFYDPSGRATWAYISGGTWDATNTVFIGDVYVPSGSFFRQYDPARFRVNDRVGTASITFVNANIAYVTARMQYASFPSPEIYSTPFDKKITPLSRPFGGGPTDSNYSDMWWGGGSQNGWGITIIQNGTAVFAPWFTYAEDGRPTWYVFEGNSWSGETVSGVVYRVTGAPLLGVHYNNGNVHLIVVGSGSMRFTAPNTGVFNYVIDNVTGTQPIEKFAF